LIKLVKTTVVALIVETTDNIRITNEIYKQNTQRINNKDAHRFNDSGAPRLGNVWVYGREMVSETVS